MLEKVKVGLRPIVSNINLPTVLKTAILPGDTSERLFIATQVGEIFYVGRCCLKFLETHETKELANTEFPEMWITPDKLLYVLNNVLKKG